MKVESVDVWGVPYIAPVRQVGSSNPPFVVVRVRTDDGLTGLGEAWGADKPATERAAQAFVGKGPLALDLLPERVNALGDELGVAARYADLDAMIAETRPDIVAVPTGTEFHYPLATRVLERGVHVDVEKPMGVDLDEADALVAKAAAQGVRLAVHHQWRVGCHMRAVRRAVAEGTIGELHGAMPQRKGYYGGFGLMDVGTHMILATSPGPRSKTVYARRARSWSARQRRRVLRERSADRHGRRVGVFGSGRRSPGWAITGSPPRT